MAQNGGSYVRRYADTTMVLENGSKASSPAGLEEDIIKRRRHPANASLATLALFACGFIAIWSLISSSHGKEVHLEASHPGKPMDGGLVRDLPRAMSHGQLVKELDAVMARVASLEKHVSNVDRAIVDRVGSASEGAAAAAQGGTSTSTGGKPSKALEIAKAALAKHMADVAANPANPPRIPKLIHQVYGLFGDTKPPWYLKSSLDSFRIKNPGHTHVLWGPFDIQDFVKEYFPSLWPVFQRMTLPILKADLARYLLVYIFGGAYADVDTRCLQPVDSWADGHANVSLIVGIEVDAAGVNDWAQHWGRQLQICQWAFAATPLHPVIGTSVYKISSMLAARLVEDVQEKEVTAVTGPSVFTDAVYDYMRAAGRDWRELLGKGQSELVGDMYVLSITGFSPGVGHMGSKNVYDPEAKVQHLFGGSWTTGSNKPKNDNDWWNKWR